MNTITLKGKILFNPTDKTKKHISQSSWKIIAMIMFTGDVCEYYSWFLKKRFNLKLNKPLRGPHITFINDKISDIEGEDDSVRLKKWEELSKKWDGKEIEVNLCVDVRTNGKSWWFNIPEEERDIIHSIRNEIGIGRPYFGLHMSIGRAYDGFMMENSEYIYQSIKNNYIK